MIFEENDVREVDRFFRDIPGNILALGDGVYYCRRFSFREGSPAIIRWANRTVAYYECGICGLLHNSKKIIYDCITNEYSNWNCNKWPEIKCYGCADKIAYECDTAKYIIKEDNFGNRSILCNRCVTIKCKQFCAIDSCLNFVSIEDGYCVAHRDATVAFPVMECEGWCGRLFAKTGITNTCNNCIQLFADFDQNQVDVTDETYRELIEPDNEPDPDYIPAILNYDIDPMDYLNFIGTPKNNLYFGIEYEILPNINEVRRKELALLIRSDFPDECVCVHDGSIEPHGQGFEVVTAPMTFDLQKDFQTRFFAKEYDYDSYNNPTCSVHVHMSRKAFTPIQLAKFKTFFYSHKNRNFIEAIADRELQTGHGLEYASLDRNYKITDLAFLDKRLRRDKKALFRNPDPENYERSRYTAVNCDNKNTVEIRIFKGCNKLSTMLKNLEFCQMMFDFTLINRVPISRINDAVPEVLAFVKQYGKIYPNLNRFIRRY